MGVNRLDKIHIAGGTPLHGTIRIQGSKNAALPMMAAALLYPGVSILRNCPKIADVFCLEEIRSEEHTSELQSHSDIAYAVFC